jgi:hypothetical protein
MLLLKLLAVCAIGGWIGSLAREGIRAIAELLGFGVLFLLVGLLLVEGCETFALADALRLTYVVDHTCLLGGTDSNLIAVSYGCFAAGTVAAFRTARSKGRRSDA